MPNFDWQDEDGRGGRIPSWARGAGLWNDLIANPSLENLAIAFDQLQRLIDQRGVSTPDLRCPRVFISHRQDDVHPARRIAWLATRARFEYWLDVEEPRLAGLQPSADTLLVACLIELALLNCSHVLAVITDRTRGSMWVPYEYGRVKKLPAGSQAGCWLAPSVRVFPLTPEYLQLGVVTTIEDEIVGWLTHERAVWRQTTGLCADGSTHTWRREEPRQLP